MKKFIQVSLVIVLVLVLLQAAAGGPMASAGKMGSIAHRGASFTANTSVEDVHAAACFVRIRIAGVICVTPNVGWNS